MNNAPKTIIALAASLTAFTACGSTPPDSTSPAIAAPAVTTPATTTAPAATTPPTTSPTTTAAPTTTTPTTTTTIPEPVDVNVIYKMEGDLAESQVQVKDAIEATVRTFPNLPPPDETLALIFQNIEFLGDNFDPGFAQAFTARHGHATWCCAGLAGGDDPYFAVQAPSAYSLANDGLSTVSHEMFHVLQAQTDLREPHRFGPKAVVEGSARYAEGYVAWHASDREEPLHTYLESRWGGSNAFEFCMPNLAIMNAANPTEEYDAITELGCDPYDMDNKRPVRSSLDTPGSYSSYNDWAGLLHLWAEEQGASPMTFLSDIWSYQGSFEEAWEHVYGVPYSSYESWVADLIEADEAALMQWQANR